MERYICVGFFSVFFTFFPSSRVLQYDQRLKIRIIESLFSNFKKYLPQRKDNLSSCLKKTTLTLHRINTDNLYALLTAYMFITVLFFYRYDISYKIIPILYKMMYLSCKISLQTPLDCRLCINDELTMYKTFIYTCTYKILCCYQHWYQYKKENIKFWSDINPISTSTAIAIIILHLWGYSFNYNLKY